MAISDRIRAEASRTIDGMQKFYEKYSDDTDDAEELEHRIARVEASMEGCNGLTQDEKIQKTAENVFELTCAQERNYDAIRREIKITRDGYKEEFRELRMELKKGLDDEEDRGLRIRQFRRAFQVAGKPRKKPPAEDNIGPSPPCVQFVHFPSSARFHIRALR